MRQVYIPRSGSPEVLCLRDVPPPPLTDTTIRLAVQAIGVNFAAIMACQRLYPDCPRPPVVGYEVAGTLAAAEPGHAAQYVCACLATPLHAPLPPAALTQ
jgi:NADPH:quinone reductase